MQHPRMIDGRKLQTALRAHGLDIGPIDGIAGARTYGGLFSYLAKRALPDALVFGRAAVTHWPDFGITTELRIAHWMAQAAVESGAFQRMEENLNYSAKRIVEVWPSRFRSITTAQPYAYDPEMLANKVYGGRLGNTAPGDGWLYRGRGFGITGRANYAAAEKASGIPLLAHPEMLMFPDAAVQVFCAYWRARFINIDADDDDVMAVTRKINGGTNGLASRKDNLQRMKELLL